MADCNEIGLQELASTLPGDNIIVPTDVSSDAAVRNLAEIVYKRFGRVDLLFNNAGVLSSGLSWEICGHHLVHILAHIRLAILP